MRVFSCLALVLSVTAVVSTPTAAAACGSDGGCPLWHVAVNEQGFIDTTNFTASKGDMLQVTLTSEDLEGSHTLTLSGYAQSATLDSLGDANWTVPLTQTGVFTLTDMASGQTRSLTVVACDAQDYIDGFCNAPATSSGTGTPGAAPTSTSKGTPTVAPGLAVGALAALAAVLRRRI